MEQQTVHDLADHELWLGYDGLSARYAEISALLVYAPAWDRRIAQSFGTLPDGVQAVVLLKNGRVLPARRALDDLRKRVQSWRDQFGGDRADSMSEFTLEDQS